jgi:hypothetical protein
MEVPHDARNYLYVTGVSVIEEMAGALDYGYDGTVKGYPGMPQETPRVRGATGRLRGRPDRD